MAHPLSRLVLCAAAAAMLSMGWTAPAAAAFKRGLNVSHWLQYDGRQPTSRADMDLIATTGFDHVRIPFDPAQLGWDPLALQSDQPMAGVERLDQAVDMALAAGLSVIIDFHPTNKLQEVIEGNPAARASYVAVWSWLAKRYANRPTDRVAFELMNEPQYYARGATAWNVLQARVAEAVRAAAPKNLLILSGIHGSSIEALGRTAVLNDRNVCYVFHFYDPQVLTHLGADWDPYPDRAEGMLRNLIYPATDMNMSKVDMKPGARVSVVGEAMRKYLNEGWNFERITREIEIARTWAASNHLCLQATEFGALRGVNNTSYRLRWMADVRRAMENANVGWTLWDYADLFGVANTIGDIEHINPETTVALKGGHVTRTFDPLALVALGIKPKDAEKSAP